MSRDGELRTKSAAYSHFSIKRRFLPGKDDNYRGQNLMFCNLGLKTTHLSNFHLLNLHMQLAHAGLMKSCMHPALSKEYNLLDPEQCQSDSASAEHRGTSSIGASATTEVVTKHSIGQLVLPARLRFQTLPAVLVDRNEDSAPASPHTPAQNSAWPLSPRGAGRGDWGLLDVPPPPSTTPTSSPAAGNFRAACWSDYPRQTPFARLPVESVADSPQPQEKMPTLKPVAGSSPSPPPPSPTATAAAGDLQAACRSGLPRPQEGAALHAATGQDDRTATLGGVARVPTATTCASEPDCDSLDLWALEVGPGIIRSLGEE